MTYYLIGDDQLGALKKLAHRLYSEERMDGDAMRNAAQALDAIARVCAQIPCPPPDPREPARAALAEAVDEEWHLADIELKRVMGGDEAARDALFRRLCAWQDMARQACGLTPLTPAATEPVVMKQNTLVDQGAPAGGADEGPVSARIHRQPRGVVQPGRRPWRP